MNRTALCLLAATAVVSAGAAVPAAGGSPSATMQVDQRLGRQVVRVSTDTPLSALGPTRPYAAGAPVYPGPYRVTQPDGTRLTLTAWGDSQTTGYQTKGGYTVVEDASGVWRYAVRTDAAGRPLPSSLEAGKATPPAASRTLRRQVVARGRTARTSPRTIDRRAPGTGSGSQPELVILVSFANQPSVGTTEAQWASDFFGTGATVAGYYSQNSFGAFGLVPAAESFGTANNGVVGWLQLPYNHPDFGRTYGPSEVKLTVDALKAADPYVDYASFDANHDGVLSTSELHVTIIAAGYETSFGGEGDQCGPSVWGHQHGIGADAPRLDGALVNKFGGTMFGEFMCTPASAPGRMSSIGIMAHELGHDIGFPDLYDTDFTSAGIGDWSIMSGGSWNAVGTDFPGTTPAGLDAFSKSYQGWITPTQVVGSVPNAQLPAAATSPTAYELGANPGGVDWKFESHQGSGDYFLVENREAVGFDAGLPSCGLIVYHVDESVTDSNQANADDAHRLVDVVEADGSHNMDTYGYPGSAADVWPGSSGHVDFSDATVPAATLYSGQPSGAAMHVNTGCAPTMSASFFTPLPNDSFASALALTPPSGTVSGGNNGATKEAGEPAVAANPGGASVWWRFTAPADGRLRLSTAGSTFDTLLGVYRGTAVSALTEVASNDNAAPNDPASAVVARVKRGVTYHVAVDGQNLGAGPGEGIATLGYSFTPVNDDLKHARNLKGAKGKKRSSTLGATKEPKEARKIAGKRSGATVWYKYRAKTGGRLTLDLSGSRFNTLLAVYTGSRVPKLHQVAVDDNHGAGRTSRVSFTLRKGQTYRICVAGVKTAAGTFTIRWQR